MQISTKKDSSSPKQGLEVGHLIILFVCKTGLVLSCSQECCRRGISLKMFLCEAMVHSHRNK